MLLKFFRLFPIRTVPSNGELTDGEGYWVPTTHKDIGPFDDLVSPLLPYGVKDAEMYKGEKDP